MPERISLANVHGSIRRPSRPSNAPGIANLEQVVQELLTGAADESQFLVGDYEEVDVDMIEATMMGATPSDTYGHENTAPAATAFTKDTTESTTHHGHDKEEPPIPESTKTTENSAPEEDETETLKKLFKAEYLKYSSEPSKTCTFRPFARYIKYTQQTWVKLVNTALIAASLLMQLVVFSIDQASNTDEDQVSDESFLKGGGKSALLLLVLFSGLRGVVTLILGLPNLRVDCSAFWCILLDCAMWIVSLGVTSFNVHRGFEDGGFRSLGQNAFLIAIRLNTNLAFNLAVDEIFADHQRALLVSVAKVVGVIEKASIPSKYKTTLTCLLDATGTDQNGLMNETDYTRFEHSCRPIFLYWKRMLATEQTEQRNANRELDIILQLRKDLLYRNIIQTCAASEEEAIMDSEESGGSIFATVFLAANMLRKQQEFMFAGVFVIICCSAMIPRAVSFIVGILVNLGIELAEGNEEKQAGFNLGLAAVLALFLLDECLYYSASLLAARMIAAATARLQSKMVHAVLFSGATFEKNYRPGALSNQFNSGIAKLGQVWDFLVLDMLLATASLFAALLFLGLVNFGFMVFVLSALPILAALKPLEGKALVASELSTESDSRLLGRFQNAVAIQRAAKVGNATKFVSDKVHSPALKEARSNRYNAWFWSYIVSAMYGSVGAMLALVTNVLFLGALASGRIDSGEFFSVTSLIAGVIAPLERIGRFSGQVAQTSGAVLQIAKILTDAEDDTVKEDELAGDNSDSAKPTLSLQDKLVFDGVKFSYSADGPLILKGLSTAISAGSYVAVLGTSGSGKSTLLSLLMGTHNAADGNIRMDGISIGSVPLRTLRESLGTVFQQTFVFDGSIRDNIAFGSDHATFDVIVDSAKKAGIHDVIQKLPQQYDTIIGKEASISMSGGQLQRICGIARALARKPKILLLDEATSALDTVTEQKFIETIEKLRDEGLTIISVTHHPSTAVNADQILVLDQGVIIENGTYDELTKGDNPGLFADLVNAGTQPP
ncbi:Lactococcin-G-processing and transport ATP-binding protein LagD [Seminavis robusta]|uniref:Lactococcin-G-processing and transport ATP-binding protein LagD n=1 Tax=Seminavis robusta TaxID=568900 RepID=A0A9N8HT46_9STRA|nr:Lactococcin-G-processing and transport ATP-binding protein LagD [Seminavis robusta]|eukprot:Sro1820_g299730.1 Lactococcin-G-processing and transport ATP-binding protein LagD (1009) ;mRNA; r:14747-17859